MIPFEVLDDYVRRGLLTCDVYGPLRLYNYSRKCMYEGAWDEVTRSCRGLILHTSGEVVARPWAKFFNAGEKHAHVPASKPDVVTVKLDGALGISYRAEGRLRFSTRGRFHTKQALVAEAMWAERYSKIVVPDEYTLLVEIIHPVLWEDDIVIRYDFEDLVVLGLRNRHTGYDLTQDEVDAFCQETGLWAVERVDVDDLSSAQEIAKGLDATREGFVLRWGDQRLKVKSSGYLEVQRAISGFNERAAGDAWFHRRPFPASLPEETRTWGEQIWSELEGEVDEICREVAEVVIHHAGLGQKELAQAVNGHPLFGAIMDFKARPEIARDRVRLTVYKRRFGGGPR